MYLVPGTWYPHTKGCAASDEIMGVLAPVLHDASQIDFFRSEVAPPITTAAVVGWFLQGLIRRIRICHERLYKDVEQMTLLFFS